ncbi:MAG TPA: pirin-like C-terminal cupin domain-containing protein, partial [Pseudomonadales bacterium]
LGGDALDAPRHLYWNFVSSRLERIEQAKEDWRNQRFAMIAGDPEFIPLPD